MEFQQEDCTRVLGTDGKFTLFFSFDSTLFWSLHCLSVIFDAGCRNKWAKKLTNICWSQTMECLTGND